MPGSELFTRYNCELAAQLHGDLNPIHRSGNEFGVQVVPGMQQLQVALAMNGWQPGKTLSISFQKPITIPSGAAYVKTADGFAFKGEQIFSTGKVAPYSSASAVDFPGTPYLRKPVPAIASEDLYSQGLPDFSILPVAVDSQMASLVYSVGRAMGALVDAFAEQPALYPDLYFPPVRNGNGRVILEEKLVLHMDKKSASLDVLALSVVGPVANPGNKRGVIFGVKESSTGLYTLEVYLALIAKPTLERMLKSA